VKVLITLCRASGLYPKCLVLDGIELIGNPVAAGGFADVYKGRLEGQEIATKVLRVYQKSDIEKLLKEFVSEAVTWRQLSHPNVLPFYGICHLGTDRAKVCFVCPWMEHGNIVTFLDNNPNTDCVLLSLDIAEGLEYLHDQGIVHGDLKGLNILVSQSRRACIADFGLATALDSKQTTTITHTPGTLRWQAPEFFASWSDSSAMSIVHGTFATDVYAFALVCYQMFSGQIPFYEYKKEFQIIQALTQGRRPSCPLDERSIIRGLNDTIWHDLIEPCWAQCPLKRPLMSQIVGHLRALPNRPVDERQPDKFNVLLPTQILTNEAEHPFSPLTTQNILADLVHRGVIPVD